jgi:hypothetical protein
MKCNSVEYMLKKQTQKGVAHEKVPTVKLRGDSENSQALAIEDASIADYQSLRAP